MQGCYDREREGLQRAILHPSHPTCVQVSQALGLGLQRLEGLRQLQHPLAAQLHARLRLQHRAVRHLRLHACMQACKHASMGMGWQERRMQH